MTRCMHSSVLRAATATALALAIPLGVGPAQAQSLGAIRSTGPTLLEFTGEPDVCGYPTGPLLSFFAAGPGSCPVITPFPEVFGGIAIDHVLDTVWGCDGTTFTNYTSDGIYVTSFTMPAGSVLGGEVLGIAIDSLTHTLWVTDGAGVANIAPPIVVPPCATPPTVLAAFTPSIVLAGALTDLAWDPATSTLWACDELGDVHHLTTTGAMASPSFSALGCVGGPELRGIATDTASGNLYVTDGAVVAYLTPTGAVAPTTFYTSTSCAALPPGAMGTSGLAFAARPLLYGTASDPTGTPPLMTAGGQSFVGSGSLSVTLSAADPGSLAYLIFDFAPACPPLPFKGVPLYTLPTFLIGPFPVPGTGSITLPLALTDPSVIPGVPVFMQWLVKKPSPAGLWEASEGLAFTTALP